MDPQRFIQVLEKRFRERKIDLENEERRLRIQIADALLDAGFKAFAEYPYAGRKALCDLVITANNDYKNATDWIELKPILDG